MSFSVRDLCSDLVHVAGIEREKVFFIPSDTEEIRQHDLVYFFGDVSAIESIAQKIENAMPASIKKVVIFICRRRRSPKS